MGYSVEYTHTISFETLEEAEAELERLYKEYKDNPEYEISNAICRGAFEPVLYYEFKDGKINCLKPDKLEGKFKSGYIF